MTNAEYLAMITKPALAVVAHSIGARRCLIDLGTYQGKRILCQVVTQGGMDGLNMHREKVHGIEAPR